MEKTYSNRSNANRAATKALANMPEGSTKEVWQVSGGWMFRVEAPAPAVADPEANPVTPAAPLPRLANQFANLMASYQSGGYSKCKALRATAAEWQANGNSRQQFVLSAGAQGIEASTAGANWAAMKRGEL